MVPDRLSIDDVDDASTISLTPSRVGGDSAPVFSFAAQADNNNNFKITKLPQLSEFEAPLLTGQSYGEYSTKIHQGFLLLPTISKAVARKPCYKPEEEACIKACIASLLHCGIIEKSKRRGPFLAYPKIIPKPNGSPRFLVDYSKLTNNITTPKCSLPLLLVFCVKLELAAE